MDSYLHLLPKNWLGNFVLPERKLGENMINLELSR